jgi:hypothetical protein
VMQCTLPPHRVPVSFSSYEDYEVHYQQFHVNRCSECGKNFPSEQFLTLHIEEYHDPLMEARREKGERTVRSESPRSSAPTYVAFIRRIFTDNPDKCSTDASSKAARGSAPRRRNEECI